MTISKCCCRAQSRPCLPDMSAFPLPSQSYRIVRPACTKPWVLSEKANDCTLGRLQETRKIKEKVPDEDARKPALRQLLHKVSPGQPAGARAGINHVGNEMNIYNVLRSTGGPYPGTSSDTDDCLGSMAGGFVSKGGTIGKVLRLCCLTG